MNIDATIIASSASYVKPRSQTRQLRREIAIGDIDPAMRALSRHIAHCRRKKKPVRIPAMRVSDWGHFLRALELKRMFTPTSGSQNKKACPAAAGDHHD